MGKPHQEMQTLSAVVTLALALGCGASETFMRGVAIPVHANKVGPFSNPSETYPFYSMPFCQPEKLVYEDLDLGQILRGDRFVNTKFDLGFAGNVHNRLVCHKTLTQEDQIKLKNAIDADYYFELVVDELPLFGFIGEKEIIEEEEGEKSTQTDSQYFVFTHLDFAFYYNNEHQTVDANISTDQRYRAEIAGKHEGQTDVTFTYSVTWTPSDIHHSHRVEKYSMSGFRQQHMQIHWISIVNSCVLVILLTGFLALILLRILRNDISKIVEFDEEEGDKGDEDCGWKKISGDVFRPARYGVSDPGAGVFYHCAHLCWCHLSACPWCHALELHCRICLHCWSCWVCSCVHIQEVRWGSGANVGLECRTRWIAFPTSILHSSNVQQQCGMV